MAEQGAQERTEQATPKRLEDARRKGQVARSRELVTLALVGTAIAGAGLFGSSTIDGLQTIMRTSFAPGTLPQGDMLIPFLGARLYEGLLAMLPLLAATGVVAGLATLSVGGWIFSWEAVQIDWERLDPIKGLGRMFSIRALVELVKASLKFTLVGGIAAGWLWFNADAFMALNSISLTQALNDYLTLLLSVGLVMLGPLMLIAAVDTPYQIWNHARQLRMTRRELKDDMKETEGNPELRAELRRRQQDVARERQMLSDVPDAAVVVTNPTHFSIALKYEADMQAPVVVAKGVEVLALEIRKIAKAHKVVLIEVPPLARALFHNVPVGQPIPEALYLAVAKVLAYVHDLRRAGVRINRPHKVRGIKLPPEFSEAAR